MDVTRALWHTRLGSAMRAALACTIVCCANLYGPERLRELVTFPAFSYVTTILIVSDATLGDTLRGCWQALYATIQVMIPSGLCLWAIGPARFTGGLAALAVALSSFVVALPESTELLAKRIAFGQIVIVYVGTVVHGDQTSVFMHPIHVASSTALGAFASVLAMLFPFPRLACFEMKKMSRLYAENAAQRLNQLLDAFSAQNILESVGSIAQAKSLSKVGDKLLQRTKKISDGMLWERPKIMRRVKPNCTDLEEKLQDLEIPLKWMEMALASSSPLFGAKISKNEELKNLLQNLKAQIGLKLEQTKCTMPFDATTSPETKSLSICNLPLKSISTVLGDLPASFFLYCMELLQNDTFFTRDHHSVIKNVPRNDAEKWGESTNWKIPKNIWPSHQRLDFALKCSLSLGFAVLFGLIYDKENGFWSGLTIAISFTTERQATFTVTNARAQGTAMGSVYGIISCFIFQRFISLKILPLIPWVIFTSFLMNSKLYGQAGGISAVLGALLILGRKNYGPPREFAIARITEASIGLICLILVEILFQPTRAATLAKTQLSKTFASVQDCINGISFMDKGNNFMDPTCPPLKEKHKKLKTDVIQLEKFIAEAGMEPNFWFLPFQSASYGKLLESLLKMTNLLHFVVCEIEFLSLESIRDEILDRLNNDLENFKKRVGYSLKLLENVSLIKSLALLEKELKKRNVVYDIEMGKSQNIDLGVNEEETEKILSSFSHYYSEETVEKIKEDGEKMGVVCLSGLGFCIHGLMKGTMEIEKQVYEMLKWENPSAHLNLYEISCKINALCT